MERDGCGVTASDTAFGQMAGSKQSLASVVVEDDAFSPAAVVGGAVCSMRDFLLNLFRLLDEYDVNYCVLHSWDCLPEEITSDLDLAVHPRDKHKLPLVFERLRSTEYVCFQRLNHSINGHFFVFCWGEESGVKTAAVDLVFDHRRSGLILATGEEMVEGRRRHREFWIPSQKIEFGYLLAKKAWKGKTPERQSTRLRELAEALGEAEAERVAGTVFSGNWKKQAVRACLNESLATDVVGARRQFWRTGWTRRPLQSAGFLITNYARLIWREVRPPGILVAVMGPDGVGKSTVIAGLIESLGLGFWRRNKLFHWRPQALFVKRDQTINPDPHGKPPRNALLSMAYLTAFFLDHWAGYIFKVRPALGRANFVIFDRYFHDVLVDPRRYRYGGPLWYATLLARMVPEPDVVILLDADEHAIAARKCEVPLLEIKSQLQKYRALQFQRAPKIVVNTQSGIDATLRSSSQAITEIMGLRLRNWLRSWQETAS